MSVVVMGANHRTASLGLLEAMSIDGERLPKLLDELLGAEHLSEVVVVSTCNRTEVYAVAEKFHGAYRDIRDFFSDLTFLPPESFADHLVVDYDGDAVRHLFEVSSGLDSVVVGEHEILGQVRDAWDAARSSGAAGPSLNLLFRHAVECGKRARTETSIARGATSISQAAVIMAAERLGGLSGRRAVVVGAGDMGRGMVTLLAEADVDEVVVVNRTLSRAEALAADAGARAAALHTLHHELAEADVLFTSTGASTPVLGVGEIAEVVASRGGRELLVVDIAVPRDVDPAVGQLEGVSLLDMEDLQSFAARALAERRAEVPTVQRIVEEEVSRYETASTAREVAPLIAELHSWADRIGDTELERYASRLSDLTDEERATVEGLLRGVVAKLLHSPTVRLKDASGTLRGQRLAASLRDLFDL